MGIACFYVVCSQVCNAYLIFTGFAQNRLWECRVSLLKNTGMSQKSRVFLLTFHLFLFLEAVLGGFERQPL